VVRSILLKFPKKDSAKGISRNTLRMLAKKLRISEAKVVHLALAQFASSVLRRYDADDRPLSEADLEYVRDLARSKALTGQVLSEKTLF